jgi:hypothetical protein
MATYTSTVYMNVPKFHHIGNLSQSGTVMFGAASSVGDIVFLAKVPHGAKIVDFAEWHTTGATAQGLSFGFASGIAAGGGADASCLVASGAQAARNSWNMRNMPLTISVSDLDPNKYAVLIGKIESGTATTSLMVNFNLTYRFDGPDPA